MCILCLLFGRQILKDLPNFDTTFQYPREYLKQIQQVQAFADPSDWEVLSRLQQEQSYMDDIDWEAVEYLKSEFHDVPDVFVPLKTTGDGNCLLHAVSRALWGVELYFSPLREKLYTELSSNMEWYRQHACTVHTDDEWKQELLTAARAGNALGFIHVFVLANVIRRPIIIYASSNDMERYGLGESGVAATFLPLRLLPSQCTKRPIALTWSNSVKHHYVPLVLAEGALAHYPLLTPAFAPEEVHSAVLKEYIDQNEPVRLPVLSVLMKNQSDGIERQQLQSQRLADVLGDVLAGSSNYGTRVLEQSSQSFSRRNNTNPIDGRKYDAVFRVNLGSRMTYIGVNNDDLPEDVARQFVRREMLSASHTPKIVEFIRSAPLSPSNSLFSAGGDDSRHCKWIPMTESITFANPLSSSTVEMLFSNSKKSSLLEDIDFHELDSLFVAIKSPKMQHLSFSSSLLVVRLLHLKPLVLSASLDVCRRVLLHPDSLRFWCEWKDSHGSLMSHCLPFLRSEDDYLATAALRMTANYFRVPLPVHSSNLGESELVLQSLKPLIRSPCKNIRAAVAIILINFCVILRKHPSENTRSLCLEIICRMYMFEADLDVVFSLLVALSTLIIGDHQASTHVRGTAGLFAKLMMHRQSKVNKIALVARSLMDMVECGTTT